MQTSDLISHFESQTFDIQQILSEFKKNINQNRFFSNSDFLWEQSSLVEFKKDIWKFRPDIFCLDYYSEAYFFPVILVINNLGSVFEFMPSNLSKELIIAPSKQSIIDIISI